MSDHVGRRRKPPKVAVGRIAALAAALIAVGWLLTLDEPARVPEPRASALTTRPDAANRGGIGQSAVLGDATTYEPQIYLTSDTSIGTALSKDGQWVRLLLRAGPTKITELRRLGIDEHPQFDGFVVSKDTVVWAESTSQTDTAVDVTLWRVNWKTAGKPVSITSNTGEANFYGSQHDLVVQGGRVYWVALAPGSGPSGGGTSSGAASVRTEVRSVPLTGGDVAVQRLTGAYALSAWPWAVSVGGGRGTPVTLLNLTTKATTSVSTSAAEIASCSPRWCLMGILNSNALVRLDLQRTDGSQRHRIAGNDATPTVRDVALLDRFIPLTTDRDGASGVDLVLYDVVTNDTVELATKVAGVHGRANMLWWSANDDEDVTWYAIDLRTLT